MTGSKKWPTTAWRHLLELALRALDELDKPAEWTLGGGTALALKLNHRVSYDVDIFLANGQDFHGLSPNRNAAARDIANLWQEPGNYIKLERSEGEIDFILAACVTTLSPWSFEFKGRAIQVEQPAEIVAKKLKHRGSQFLPRDIFDLIALHRFDDDMVRTAVLASPEGARRTADRITRIAPRYRQTIAEEVNPTSSGSELLEVDPDEAAALLNKFI